jgi:CubicO group peptidase (beta-lactamase class C family)
VIEPFRAGKVDGVAVWPARNVGTRRAFLSRLASATLVGTFGRGLPRWVRAAEPEPSRPWSNIFDETTRRFMASRGFPGGALAVVKEGRLVYSQGYGWADRDGKIPATANSLFRIASLSKPITAAAVLKLVQNRKLDLQARPFDLLNLETRRPTGPDGDARWKQVTVLNLLQHTGGWDSGRSFDPMFRSRQIAESFGEPSPAKPWSIIRYMLGQQLDFNPGTRYAYSNFGYCLLGRVIEHAAGEAYDSFVKKNILEPAGIADMRIGASLESGRAKGEVRYYMPDDRPARSVFPEGPRRVPWPYGGFCLESMDAHGGWIASPLDLARFVMALGGSGPGALLDPAMLKIMSQPPAPPAWRGKNGKRSGAYYGCGWMIRPQNSGRANAWHTGSLPGTTTLLVRRGDGISYAALFNQRTKNGSSGDLEIDPLLYRAADAVKDWPLAGSDFPVVSAHLFPRTQ